VRQPLRSLAALVGLSSLLTGCTSGPEIPAVVGTDGQAAARAAFERLLSDLERGQENNVWESLNAGSQARIKDDLAADKGKPGPGEKAKALQILRKTVGPNPRIKEVFGTRGGAEIVLEFAGGNTRALEMVQENGAWKLNLFSS
jgi:hypothetical protein